jgi:16S rRNA (guanine527-N7)-methyltransferase
VNHPDGDGLDAVLNEAHTLGFFGPGPVAHQRRHADGFRAIIETATGVPPRVADLGSGGGVPGLVLAWAWPSTEVVLFEAMRKRAGFLTRSIDRLGWTGRVQVVAERAESAAHHAAWRERFTVVTARGFDRPAVTAEVAVGLLAVGGLLVVSEPPGGEASRWPAEGLDELGFEPAHDVSAEGASYVEVRKTRPAPSTLPRSTKSLVKRPAW